MFSFSNSWGQTVGLVGFACNDNSGATHPVPSIDNVAGTPAFSSSGVSNLSYFSTSCEGSHTFQGRTWGANDYFRITFTGTCFKDFILSFCDRASASDLGNFKVRVSTDLTTWTDVIASYAPSTTFTTRTSGMFPVGCNNSTNVYVDFYKVDNAVSTGTWYNLDDILITGTSPISTTVTTTSQTVCSGSSVGFSFTDDAVTPAYQWQMSANGTSGWANVTNATPLGSSYTGSTTNSISITAGSSYFYRCLVTDNSTSCSTISKTYSLVVNTAPSITLAPVSKTVCSGSNVSFTTSASGTSPTYQWQQNSGSGFADIAGATTKTLTLSSVTSSMNTYSYQCVVSVISCGSDTTTPVVLTVNTTPSAPPAPSPVANPACSTGTLSALSSTVAGVTWYWVGTSSVGTSTANVSSSTYTYASSGTYYIRALDVSGTCWSLSQGISVTVNTPVTITSGASDKGLCSGGNTSMDITGAAATKQWYVSTDNGATFNAVSLSAVYTAGITTNNLTITNPPVSYNGYQYYCTVSVSGCPTLTSSIGVLTVTQTPSAPPTPTALANPACSGTSLAAMTNTVSGVTWYWQGTNSAGTSTTNPTSSVYNVTSSGTYYVRARTDGSSCLSSSSSTAITVNTPPTISTNPIDKTQCVGTNTTFSVSASGTSLTYQWQYNTGGGFVNVPNSAPYSNVTSATMSVTNITAGMNGYQYQCVVSGASPCSSATSTVATLIITASGAPATAASSPATSAVGCNAFNISWTNGSGSNRLVVVSSSPITGSPANGTSYTASTTFGSGNTIAAGEFVVYKGTGSSIFVVGLSASTTYYYKIFEFNGCSASYLTSGTIPGGNETTISCTNPAGVTAVYVDACSGSCGYEGNNELIWGNTGSYGMAVSNNGPTLNYNSTSPPTTPYITTYGQYSSNITALNTAVTSCTNTVFVDPNTQGYIPPNSKFLIAHSCMCSPAAYDFLNLCNSGPIYVVFGNDATWPCNGTGGIFGNSGSGVRYFDLDFSSWGVSLDPIFNFSPSSLVGGDGAYALFSPSGGAATTYSNSGTGCEVPIIILPIDLLDFYGTQDEEKNVLTWKVASEKNVMQYIVEKSEDGISYKELTRVNSLVSEGKNMSYSCVDNYPNSSITYYRLSTIEKNQKRHYYKIIDIDRGNKNWESLLYQNEDELILEFKNSIPRNAQLLLFDLSGKLIIEEFIKDYQTKVNVVNISSGIYFARITTPYKTENFKIMIQNDK